MKKGRNYIHKIVKRDGITNIYLLIQAKTSEEKEKENEETTFTVLNL